MKSGRGEQVFGAKYVNAVRQNSRKSLGRQTINEVIDSAQTLG